MDREIRVPSRRYGKRQPVGLQEQILVADAAGSPGSFSGSGDYPMHKLPYRHATTLPALSVSSLRMPVFVLMLLVALGTPVDGDTISCPSGYTCTSCGGSLCIVCPSEYYCLLDEDAAAQFGTPEKLYNWPCGLESGIDTVSKFCYRQSASTTPLVAKINPDSSQGTAPFSVDFTAAGSTSSAGQISSYSWNFGDGQTGAGFTVSHTYQYAGTYSPALTVSNGAGQTGTAYGTIIVSSPVQNPQVIIDANNGGTAGTAVTNQQNRQPVAVFSATPDYGTPPLAVSFDGLQSFDPDGSIAAYAWDFGDGIKGSGYVATHTYGKAGTYSASLTVTDNAGSVSPASYATITAAESKPVLTAATADSGKPRITVLVSDPDYTNADFMRPDSKVDVIPREYKGSIAVSGGTLVIKGSHFGNQKGTVKMILDKDIEGYSLDKPYQKMALTGTKNTPVWVGITRWSDSEIALNVMDIHTLLRTNFGGGTGKITVVLPDGTTSNPYTFYLSPKWQLVNFSGVKFFNPSHNEDVMDGYTSRVQNHVLIVKHDPRCEWYKFQGDEGRDDFFRESWPLPPNVRFSQVRFQELKGDIDWFALANKIYNGVNAIVSLNYFEMAKMTLILLAGAIDGKAGTYTAYVADAHEDPATVDPSSLTYQKEYMVHWENTCFRYSLYDNTDIAYLTSFSAYAPDGVDLGE
jgi:PKD repeat protein